MAFKTTATEYLKHSNNNNNSNNNSNSSRIEKKKEIYEGDGGYSHPSIIFAFVTKLLSWAPVYFCLAIQWHDYVLGKSFLVCGRMASAVGLSISFVSCNKRPWTVRSWNMKMTGFFGDPNQLSRTKPTPFNSWRDVEKEKWKSIREFLPHGACLSLIYWSRVSLEFSKISE